MIKSSKKGTLLLSTIIVDNSAVGFVLICIYFDIIYHILVMENPIKFYQSANKVNICYVFQF